MSMEIIGAESMGVRSLCCLVTLPDRRIVIDPGVALGYVRHGLLPVWSKNTSVSIYQEINIWCLGGDLLCVA